MFLFGDLKNLKNLNHPQFFGMWSGLRSSAHPTATCALGGSLNPSLKWLSICGYWISLRFHDVLPHSAEWGACQVRHGPPLHQTSYNAAEMFLCGARGRRSSTCAVVAQPDCLRQELALHFQICECSTVWQSLWVLFFAFFLARLCLGTWTQHGSII